MVILRGESCRLTNLDYYLTTILENAEKLMEPLHCNGSKFFNNFRINCAIPLKPLQIQGSPFYGLITPTSRLHPTTLRSRKPLRCKSLRDRDFLGIARKLIRRRR